MHIEQYTDTCILSKILLNIVSMDPLDIRDDLRNFLNSAEISLAEIERNTSLNRSWLSKFRRGEITNPTIEQLNALHRYREQSRGRAVPEGV